MSILVACGFVAVLAGASPPAHAASCGDGMIQTSENCDDGNHVSGDGCNTNCNVENGYTCIGTRPSVCFTSACGNGIVDSREGCDDGDRRSGDGCDADCRIEHGYDCVGGHPSVCNIVQCGNGIVQADEECDGGGCCDEQCRFVRAGRVCHASRGECDRAETCSGRAASCPVDAHKITVCRPSLGPCDPAERCVAGLDECPADERSSGSTICRAARGGCDVDEFCDGASAACPADEIRGAGKVCRAAVSPECDVAEVCDGASTTCPDDVLVGCRDVDGIDCVHPACGADGRCTTTDDCVEICRQPPYWGNHSGNEKDRRNLTQAILDQVGPLEICGQRIDETDLGELDSAVEALCVKGEGVRERNLFRALVTTALNCAVSEGGTCDEILARFVDVSFTECNARCEGDAPTGAATVRQCIHELFCFNRGGTIFGGRCALGTCGDDPGELCGDDFGQCASGRCVPFDGNCSDARLCTTGLETDADLCFAGRARPSSPKLCRQARRNGCTIDSCPR